MHVLLLNNGVNEEQIPGTYYDEVAGVKYLYTDASTAATIVMHGYDSGTFTLQAEQYSGDTLTASTTFQDIPTTARTTVSLHTQSDLSTLSPMKVDENGDGSTIYTLTPKLGAIVTLDTTPPEALITYSTSTKSIKIGGTDDQGATTQKTVPLYRQDCIQYKKDARGRLTNDCAKYQQTKTGDLTTITDSSGNTLSLTLRPNEHTTKTSRDGLKMPAFLPMSHFSTLPRVNCRYP